MKNLNNTRLCFDPAIPRRFTVFMFMHDRTGIISVEVYSSEKGQWTSMRSEWSPKTLVLGEDSRCVFFNGALHLATSDSHSAYMLDQEEKLIRWIVAVDTEGKAWRRIQMPHDTDSSGFIGQSQGRLCAARICHENGCQLSVWVLEDYASGKWRELGEGITVSELFGREPGEDDFYYNAFAIHPDSNCIFLTDEEEMTLSYDMESKKVNVISSCQGFQNVPLKKKGFQNALPYKPCFAKWKWTPDGR
jgi:hypothetical protein